MFLRRSVLTAKCPYGEMSYGEMSNGDNSYGEKSGHSSITYVCRLNLIILPAITSQLATSLGTKWLSSFENLYCMSPKKQVEKKVKTLRIRYAVLCKKYLNTNKTWILWKKTLQSRLNEQKQLNLETTPMRWTVIPSAVNYFSSSATLLIIPPLNGLL